MSTAGVVGGVLFAARPYADNAGAGDQNTNCLKKVLQL